MTVKSLSSGHQIYFDGGKWRYSDTKEVVNHERACSTCGKEQVIFKTKSGKSYGVDYCIASVVAALNMAGIETMACCCGHSNPKLSSILLRDGRVVCVYDYETWQEIIKR